MPDEPRDEEGAAIRPREEVEPKQEHSSYGAKAETTVKQETGPMEPESPGVGKSSTPRLDPPRAAVSPERDRPLVGNPPPNAQDPAAATRLPDEPDVRDGQTGDSHLAQNGVGKRLFGTRKKQLKWLIGAVVVIALIVGAILGGNYIREQIEARNAAVLVHESAARNYQDSWRILSLAITDGVNRNDTSDEMVAEVSVLDRFEASLKSAITAHDSKEKPDEIDLDLLSTEEILDLSATLYSSATLLDQASQDLTFSVEELDATVAEKERLDEEARLAAEEKAKKDKAGRITFEKLARSAETVIGNYYRFEGKIIQDAGSGSYRVSITRDPGYSIIFWEDPILISVDGDTKERLLEDDIISFVGMSLGMHTYESIFGESIEVPLVSVDGPDVKVTGHDD